MALYTLYLLRCRDDSLYAGIAVSLDARVAVHNAGKGARYTRSRRPVVVAWSRPRLTESRARRLEYAVKQLPRTQKARLVAGDQSIWRALTTAVRKPGATA